MAHTSAHIHTRTTYTHTHFASFCTHCTNVGCFVWHVHANARTDTHWQTHNDAQMKLRGPHNSLTQPYRIHTDIPLHTHIHTYTHTQTYTHTYKHSAGLRCNPFSAHTCRHTIINAHKHTYTFISAGYTACTLAVPMKSDLEYQYTSATYLQRT